MADPLTDISWAVPRAVLPDPWFVSPTLANQLVACAMRAAWRFDPSVRRLRRPTPHTQIGNVAHRVREAVSRGLLDGCRSSDEVERSVRAEWQREIAAASAEMSTAWAPATPPRPEDWPGHQLVLARTIIWARHRAPGGGGYSPGSDRRATVETELADAVNMIKGTPDLVERHGDVCVVVDLKTGLAQDDITEDQRRQLLIYAHLVAVNSADTPSSIAVENPLGRRWEEPVHHEEWDRAVAETVDRRRELEAAIASGSVEDLARPSAETCRYCPYRPVCGPYWRNVRSDWNHRNHQVVAGHLRAIGGTDGDLSLEIEATYPSDAHGLHVVTRVPSMAPDGPPLEAVAVVGAELNGSPTNLRGIWSTIAWWHEG